MENTQSLPVTIATDKLVEIVQTAPTILASSRISRDKAINYGKNLLDKAEEFGMNDELDTLMADYQTKLRVTYKSVYENRRPFTQIVDEVKKEFTSLESDIDPAGKANIYADIQRIRNIYVNEKIEAQKKRDAEILRRQNIEKERIEIEKQVEIAINESFSQYVSGVKRAMNNIFEGMKLDSVEATRKMIVSTPVSLAQTVFNEFGNKPYFTAYISTDDVKEIISQKASESCFADLNDVCAIELMEYRRELIEKIPSKVQELEEIAAAGAQEARRLQIQAEERQLKEAARLELEQKRKSAEAVQASEVAAAGKALEAIINTQAQLFSDAPKTKDSYQIEVLNRAGYGLIFQFWFEKEGRGLPAEKIEKKTIGQMKSFCESCAMKNDEKIVSPLLKYVEVYKAK